MNYHSQSIAETAEALKTSPAGLSTMEAKQRMEKHGKNLLEAKKKKTIISMLLSQLTDFMILVLVAAAVVSGFIGDLTDTIVILAIVIINAVIGLVQEWRAEKAMEALEGMAASQARVQRDHQTIEIDAADLVPGDVILVEVGNIIPADVRFIETYTLKVDESSLTGESVNIEKNIEPLPEGDYPLGDRLNMGYKGTNVTNGRASAYVVATGMNTELGRIAKMIQTEEIKTPLQKKLNAFGKRLTIIILILCVVFFLVGWLRGQPWSVMLLTSISLAVAAIPEALPALVTIALALGAKRLVKNNALIRKLPAVETLGSVTYICSDKTGTLTLNKMTVQEIYEEKKTTDELSNRLGSNVLLHAIALNNDVTKDKENKWVGESTEVALAQYALENDHDRFALERKFKRLAELPFDSNRKCMTTLHQTESGVIAIVKGAVEVLFGKLKEEEKKLIPDLELQVKLMAEKGYRTLGYAIRIFDQSPAEFTPEKIETSLTFIGFAGMIDPPREEARKAVAECKSAGIRAVMITGDHKLTAKAIAESLGIVASEKDIVLTGPELQKMNDEEFLSKVENIRVYARVDPAQKLRIISALQSKHHFVAMTGDGVNDAPALKNADIGIAMGINGTEVSKEAAHMILLDDNFATIVVAVKHGRRIFDNILKFIKYIMTGNSGEIWALFLAPLVGLPIPLLAIHILWVNLISDGLPGLALASEPSEKNIMNRPPRPPGESVFSKGMGWHILFIGFLIGIVTMGIQAWAINNDYNHWQTMTFTVLCFSQLGHVMAIRSSHRSTFALGVFSNKPMILALLITVMLQMMIIYVPFFNKIFKTAPLTWSELLITAAVSSIVFWAVELEKLIRRRRSRNRTVQ
ncbi:calcium-translocating P-type ATPase, PMCA-type [Chryseolinea sp. H1M3-3]|uniref:calcium-translocating P-type ATPase, PMCA-type n=1 Tax=Chryseolinea sp. H1M3-3 TaxID=3034144 RepID=UPI0023EAB55A|nr:calcium-translocating P-type ATPase, PMCA-type [Chryseolinea sp. H1M3-3]